MKIKDSLIISGHSYGGPVVNRHAMLYPNSNYAYMILAGSVDPNLEPHNWYRYLFKYFVFSLTFSNGFRPSNTELLPLKKELQKIEIDYSKIVSKFYVLQGDKDMFVPEGNAYYLERKIENVTIEILKDENHFITWTRVEKVKEVIFNML